MGVAIVLAPLMVIILVAPFLYLLVAFFVARAVNKASAKSTRVFLLSITLVIFSIYPAQLYLEYLEFSELCDVSRPPVTVKPIVSIDSIAIVTEGGDFDHKPFVWHRQMKLNIDTYEYAYIVNGNETMRNLCDGNTHKCKHGGNISSRYMFLVTSAKKSEGSIFQSDIMVVDRQSEQILYEANEYVLTGHLAAYHGAFLSNPGHRGYLSCGYLDGGIDVWRPNGSNSSRRRYAETDSMIIKTIFPSLKK